MTGLQEEAIRASVRVLALLEGYISTENPAALVGWNGGMMTWAELAHQAAKMRRTIIREFNHEIKDLKHEKP